MEITCVTIDSHVPGKVAAFWNEAVGWGGVAVAPDGNGAIYGPAAAASTLLHDLDQDEPTELPDKRDP